MAAVAMGLWAGAACAQPVPEYRPLVEPLGQLVRGCLDQSYNTDSALACRPLSVDACLAMGPDRDTTFGRVMCAIILEDLWDAELNRIWPLVQIEVGPDEDGSFLEEQRAWLAYRDAAIDFEVARFAGGSIAQHIGGDRSIELTAERIAHFLDILR
jgi:uncharacterized protein YecT (DUF1311 family)